MSCDRRILNPVLEVVTVSPRRGSNLTAQTPKELRIPSPRPWRIGVLVGQGRERSPSPTVLESPCAPWLAGLWSCPPTRRPVLVLISHRTPAPAHWSHLDRIPEADSSPPLSSCLLLWVRPHFTESAGSLLRPPRNGELW